METTSNASRVAGSNWLQLFSEPTSLTPGATPVPAAAPAPGPVVTPGAQQVQPGAQSQPAPAPVATQTPAPAAPAPVAEPKFLDFGGRQLPDTLDNRALHADWQRQQAALTRSQQELLKYKQMGPQQPAPSGQTAQPAVQAQGVQAQAEQRAAASLGMTNEEFQAALYGDNPKAAVEALVEAKTAAIVEQALAKRLTEALKPMEQFQQQYTVDQQLSAMSARYADFNTPDMLQRMADEFDRNPGLNQLPPEVAFDLAYRAVKGSMQSAQPAPAPAPTVDSLLNDQQTLARLAQDPRIRTLIEQENLRTAAAAQSALPPVLAGQTPGAPPVLPANKSQTPGDATKNWLSRLAAGAIGR